MTFLPIVGRELREGARRGVTYWLRVRVAAQALVVGVVAYFMALFNPGMKMGTPLFWGLSGISMLFCLLAGRRSTADCISQEKREGTLGLLFLTDLKGYDVVLGKLVGTSISGFFSLMAIFPLLAIPLLTGGMTHGELLRMALVLVNTFLLSVSIGIFASSLSRDYRMAMGLNFFLVLMLLAVPAGCGLAIEAIHSPRSVSPGWFYSCPIFSFLYCADDAYSRWRVDFWRSVTEQGSLALILLLLACLIVPRNWGDKAAPAPARKWQWRDLGSFISYGSLAKRAAFRRQALDENAFYWLAGRARLKPVHVWLLLAAGTFWFFYGWYKIPAYWIDLGTFIAAGIIVNSALKLWITVEAGNRFGEDLRSGAFELLLPTPLTVRDFLRGQMLALRRQFLKPLLLVTALEMTLIVAVTFRFPFNWITKIQVADLPLVVFTCLAGMVMLWGDVLTLAWVSMAAAFTCKSQTKATSFTVLRILILPWVGFGFVVFVIAACHALGLIDRNPGDWLAFGLWLGLGIAADLLFGLFSWRLLTKNFRQLAEQSFARERPPQLWRVLLRMAVRGMGFFIRPIPRRARIPVGATLAVCLAIAAVYFVRRPERVPPPVLVSMTQSNAPLKIFLSAEGALFVLPDGSLWHWGKTGGREAPRAAMPQQIGTGRDWVKAVDTGSRCLGLKTDGTLWVWSRFAPDPQPAVPGHDWIDVAAGGKAVVGVRRDGTIWSWNEDSTGNSGPGANMIRMGLGSNWVAASRGYGSTLALRADGTIWAGGLFFSNKRGVRTNATLPFPSLLCAESNWISLDAHGLARNRAGELWDTSMAMPDAQAGVAAVCSLVSSNWAADRIQSSAARPWNQVRADGTLWTAFPRSNDWTQMSTRTDWMAVWSGWGAGYGLTGDGTVWTWGWDFGKDPKTFSARLKLLRSRMSRGPFAYGGSLGPNGFDYEYSTQPQPLFKLSTK